MLHEDPIKILEGYADNRTMDPFLSTIEALNASGNRYVIVGGFAVVMHGVSRFTPDLNVVVDFDEAGMKQMIAALLESELEGALEGDPYDFLKPEKRQEWRSKNNQLFYSMRDKQAPTFSLDLFLEHPIDFGTLWKDSARFIVSGMVAHVCSIDHLMEMKLRANRGQDRIDVESLRLVKAIGGIIQDIEACEKHLASIENDFERGRISDLMEFGRLLPEQKMQWLVEMLTQLGNFCILE